MYRFHLIRPVWPFISHCLWLEHSKYFHLTKQFHKILHTTIETHHKAYILLIAHSFSFLLYLSPPAGQTTEPRISQALPKSGITVFGSQLHTHLRGVRVLTRHFRDGVELAELNRDDYYSHHYQEIRHLKRQIKVYPVI